MGHGLKMPFKVTDGRFFKWCVVCYAKLPDTNKTLKIPLNRAHSVDMLPDQSRPDQSCA